MWELLEKVGRPLPGAVLVQPDGMREDYDAAVRELAERVLVDDGLWNGVARRTQVRVGTQVHRVAWGAKARGV
jgi:hypothetical protein